MNNTNLPVIDYLQYAREYLNGDLNTFHKLCSDIENTEINYQIDSPNFTTSSLDTTTVTTINPSQPAVTGSLGNAGTSGYGSFDKNNITKNFRLTIPVTLMLFSISDIVGYLLRITDRPQSNTPIHVKRFITDSTNHLRKFFENLISSIELDALLEIYRHGMTHGYFPKLDVAISYHSNNPVGRLFFMDNNGLIILNVNELEIIVATKLENVLNNSTLHSDMEILYNDLINYYNQNNPRIYIETLRLTL